MVIQSLPSFTFLLFIEIAILMLTISRPKVMSLLNVVAPLFTNVIAVRHLGFGITLTLYLPFFTCMTQKNIFNLSRIITVPTFLGLLGGRDELIYIKHSVQCLAHNNCSINGADIITIFQYNNRHLSYITIYEQNEVDQMWGRGDQLKAKQLIVHKQMSCTTRRTSFFQHIQEVPEPRPGSTTQ